jgi:hypothetical protein
MRIFNICLGLIIISFIVSCNNESDELKKRIKFYKKQEFVYPKDLKHYNYVQEVDTIYTDDKLIIASYIDGNCSTCINNIKKWCSFSNEFSDFNQVEFKMYIYANNKDFIGKLMMDYKPKIIFYDDYEKLFYKKNKLIDDPRFQTFLLKGNKVLLIGNPVSNNQVKLLYKDELYRNIIKNCEQ